METVNLVGFSRTQLEQLLSGLGARPFHGRQLFRWIYQTRQYDPDRMTDLSRELRARLAESHHIRALSPETVQESSDGTRKMLFRVDGGHPVESVLIPDPESDRRTLCVSSQAGCALGCRFCATGTLGLARDLEPGEIVGQPMAARDLYGNRAFSNVVFMGMGEPLLNYDNVVAAIEIMTHPEGLGLAPRRVTVSTIGVVKNIIRLADTGLGVKLAVSLNAADEDKRAELMPATRAWGLDKLVEAAQYYVSRTGRRVTFEYVLMDGVNDSDDDMRALARLARGLSCIVNLLAYNPVRGLPFRRPAEEQCNRFARKLVQAGVTVTVRTSRGADIAAACGQLAGAAKQEK
jgi:23S rRNA (adenine2503-C2)-methyltransferase